MVKLRRGRMRHGWVTTLRSTLTKQMHLPLRAQVFINYKPLQYLYKIKLTAYHDDVAEEV
jgi:hypothetical protein